MGLQNILKGYQCGTVYKPIYVEAQAAVALALYLRAGQTPPASLVNAQTMDTTHRRQHQVGVHDPDWVTTANMASTVIKDGCLGLRPVHASVKSACTAAGIS